MSGFVPVRTTGTGAQLVQVNAGIGKYARPHRRPRYAVQPGALLAELTAVHLEGFDSTLEVIAYAPKGYASSGETVPTLFAMEFHNVMVTSIAGTSYHFTATLAGVDGYAPEDYPLIAEQLRAGLPLEDVANLISRHGGIKTMPPASVMFEQLIGMPVEVLVAQ